MIRKTITIAIAATLFSASTALACSAADVQARQGALIEAVQALLAVNPVKAQEIVAEMQTGLDTANEAGDEDAVCALMDRLTAEAQAATGS